MLFLVSVVIVVVVVLVVVVVVVVVVAVVVVVTVAEVVVVFVVVIVKFPAATVFAGTLSFWAAFVTTGSIRPENWNRPGHRRGPGRVGSLGSTRPALLSTAASMPAGVGVY